MGSLNRKAFSNKNCPIGRYESLKLKESLAKPSQYLLSCKELSFILKNAYSKSPKNLQSLVFQDTLFAFTLLPQMPTQSAISAANSLLQSAENVLPKQKRALAVKEYKHNVVASKRKAKPMQDDQRGLSLLPQDVLLHIFSFLDLQSLVYASVVCRLWNTAASDNHLWKSLYATYLCNSEVELESVVGSKKEGRTHTLKYIDAADDTDWKYAFETAYKDEDCFRKLKSHRGYCSSCRSVVWLSSTKCSNKPNTEDGSRHQIKPISTQQMVDYILDGSLSPEYSSDSDSDIEDSILSMWAYPRQIVYY